MAAETILIGIPEIAEITQVSRSAVSNWRKRYDDFPESRVQSESGVLFDLLDVEGWLLQRGKIDRPVPPGALLWRFVDALRGAWPAETLLEFTSSWLCYLEACQRVSGDESAASTKTPGLSIRPEHRWTQVREVDDEDLASTLRLAAQGIERDNPQLDDLLAFLAPDPFPATGLVRTFVAELEAATDSETPRFAIFEEAQQRAVDVARASGSFTTPDDLSYLIAGLAGVIADGSTVVDPACGTGGLLLMAAVADWAPEGGANYLGVEIDRGASRQARARFFLYGIDAEVRTANSLRADVRDWPQADLVVTDPPYGVNDWGDAELYRSSAWAYGSPPPSSADLAWVQLALMMLKPAGRAVVVLPPGSCFRAGREGEIREALLRAGVVEAVIHTPPRLRRDTSIPLTIWVLASPQADAPPRSAVLLVDASSVGRTGRSTHEMDGAEVEHLVELVGRWRADGSLDAHDRGIAMVVQTDEILASGADLVPRRYLALPEPEAAEDLAALSEAARSSAEAASTEVTSKLAALLEPGSSASSGVVSTVRLGDIAEVFRPRVSKDSGGEFMANPGDLVMRTVGTGFDVDLVGESAAVKGLHAVVIRTSRPDVVSPAWLLTWARTDEFASLVGKYATGSTIRSLSVRDVADFEVTVPSAAVQIEASDLLRRTNELIAAGVRLNTALEGLQALELRRTYAGARL